MTSPGIPVIRTQPGEKIVAYFSTRNLYNVLPAAYNSLLAFTPDVHVYCFIEDDTLPYKTPAQVTCVNVTGQTMFPEDGPCYHTQYSYMILLKTALTKIFPDADKAVILDVDTIVCADISPLWEWDLSHAYYAAVIEPEGTTIRGVPYANFGIVLLNLAKLRTSGKDDQIIHEVNTHAFSYPEQDAFSKICMNRFDPLPPDYNVTKQTFDVTGNPKRTVIKHFAGLKDWSFIEDVQYWLTHTAPPPRYVVYAGDHRIYNMLIASAKSLLHHTPVDKVFFLIDNDSIPNVTLPPIIECINVSKQAIFPVPNPNYMSCYGYMTTLRAALTKLFPDDIYTMLWLDPDTVVVDDISDIWNTDINNKYFAAVEEVRNHNHTLNPYFNAGVMLMNLRLLREDGMDDKIIHEINTVPYEHLEQDVLNYLCYMHIRRLPSCYSDSFVSAPCDHPRIKHFVSTSKPQFYKATELYNSLSWDDIRYAKKVK